MKMFVRNTKDAILSTVEFLQCLWYFTRGDPQQTDLLAACPYFTTDLHARLHVYSIHLVFTLWEHPHYRNANFHDDLVKNLRNIAIPGTCFPLSIIARFQWVLRVFLFVFYPLFCLVSAFFVDHNSSMTATAGSNLSRYGDKTTKDKYAIWKANWAVCWRNVCDVKNWHNIPLSFQTQLINPTDWFFYWRLNCHLASLHSLKNPNAIGYSMEDKWTFLKKGKMLKVPVSPCLDFESVVIKDKNEEGGMGIYFYKNALHNGDWIIQERLQNSEFISSMLPENAPLSTFRIMTSSTLGLNTKSLFLNEDYNIDEDDIKHIKALSCVFRAGLSGAKTDHESVLFDVDMSEKKINMASTTNHWYHTNFVDQFFATPYNVKHCITQHPDNNLVLTGRNIPQLDEMVSLVREAHFKMLPDVPMVGWDVALTTKGIFLLEVNLSCNFFRGTFDTSDYYKFVEKYFLNLEKRKLPNADKKMS